jgi:autoinducer 2-degrading protein
VHFEVKPGRVDRFLEVFRGNIVGGRQEPGIVRFDLLQSAENANSFMMYEIFESEEALKVHRETDHYKATVAGLEGLLVRPRSKSFMRLALPDLESGATGTMGASDRL